MTSALRCRFCVYLSGTYYVQCSLLNMAMNTKGSEESQVVSRPVEEGSNYKTRQDVRAPTVIHIALLA